MCRLQVQVFLNQNTFEKGIRVFERIVDVNENINVDYSGLVRSLKFLYGKEIVINFNLSSL